MENVLLRTTCYHTISSELFQLQSLIKKRKGNKLRKKEKVKTFQFLLNFSDLFLKVLPQELRVLSEALKITVIPLICSFKITIMSLNSN